MSKRGFEFQNLAIAELQKRNVAALKCSSGECVSPISIKGCPPLRPITGDTIIKFRSGERRGLLIVELKLAVYKTGVGLSSHNYYKEVMFSEYEYTFLERQGFYTLVWTVWRDEVVEERQRRDALKVYFITPTDFLKLKTLTHWYGGQKRKVFNPIFNRFVLSLKLLEEYHPKYAATLRLMMNIEEEKRMWDYVADRLQQFMGV